MNIYYYYYYYYFNLGFQRVNRLFVLTFENSGDRTSCTEYYLPKVEMKDYNAMINYINVFDQPINIYIKTHDN